MGGKNSGKRGTKYHFNPDSKYRPEVTWQTKNLREMDERDIANAVRYLVEGWEAALSGDLLYAYCGLDQDRIDELEKRNPELKGYREGSADRLIAIARVNIAKAIKNGGIKDSRWLLEHVDSEFKPASKLSGNIQPVIIPVEEKQQMIAAEMSEIIENIEIVEFSDESTETAAGE